MRKLISLTLFLSLTSSMLFKVKDFFDAELATVTKETVANSQALTTTTHSSFVFAGTTVSIQDASIVEGNTSTEVDTLRFAIARSSNADAFSVGYATADSTALVADNDYMQTSGSVNFTAGGSMSDTIKVPVVPDFKTELDERMKVNLTSISNPLLACFMDSIGVGLIMNNDTSFLSVRDTFINEGDATMDSLCFILDLTGELDTLFQYDYETADSTATALGGDFLTGTGSGVGTGTGSGVGSGSGSGIGITPLFFGGVDTVKIAVNDDAEVEKDEFFKVIFSNLRAFGRELFFRFRSTRGECKK